MDKYLELKLRRDVLQLSEVVRKQTFLINEIIYRTGMDPKELIEVVETKVASDVSHMISKSSLDLVLAEIEEMDKQGIRCVGAAGPVGVPGMEC